jgi:hypothetical protein
MLATNKCFDNSFKTQMLPLLDYLREGPTMKSLNKTPTMNDAGVRFGNHGENLLNIQVIHASGEEQNGEKLQCISRINRKKKLHNR